MLYAALKSCHRFCQKSLCLLTELRGQAKVLIAARTIRPPLQDTLDLQLRLIKNAQNDVSARKLQ
ncbi:hypothetical protein, partial [Pseudomonas sp. SHC52]|uniref:hypothetical protein n=1 Tax=Pseudomonas sp. SHC52 TaxID=984195 RepID=UPI001C477502